MKKVLLASAGILALAATAISAQAADLPARMPVKAPAYVAPPLYNWSGFYLGINGGGGWGRSDFSSPAFPAGSFNTSGGLVGGTLGYNWQTGPVVFGLETDLDWSGIKGSAPCGITTCSTSNTFLGTFRGRLGYAAWDRFLPYITGGLAYGNINTNVATVATGSETRAGWTLGGGLEFALAGPWTAKVEYLYVDLGRGGGMPALAGDAKFNANVFRAGVNYRF